MVVKKGLTKHHKGLLISNATLSSLNHQAVEEWISEYQFVVVKRLNETVDELKNWVSGLGPLVTNKRRVNENVLVLDGSKSEKEVIGGKGRMPLHCDGLLMGEKVRIVAIFCLETDLKSGGRTYISDGEVAWQHISENIKQVIIKNGIEILPCDKDYFVKNEHQYYKFPGVQIKNNQYYLNGGMHYHKGEPSSWLIRIQDINQDLSDEYYHELEKIYEDPEITYHHFWEKGDLLLIDNVKTMHGREAFTGNRIISQFQVKETI
jgi:(5R)-carbapenem-3-carboxylate synthase